VAVEVAIPVVVILPYHAPTGIRQTSQEPCSDPPILAVKVPVSLPLADLACILRVFVPEELLPEKLAREVKSVIEWVSTDPSELIKANNKSPAAILLG
jgi:hypothetical protein